MTMGCSWAEKKRAAGRTDVEPLMVSPDLASLLFPSPAVSIRRDLCTPELSLAALGAGLVGGIKDRFLI